MSHATALFATLAAPFVLLTLLPSAFEPPATGLQERVPARVAMVPAHTPEFNRAQERELRGVTAGREIFRYDTFGDEQLWTDVLRMHEVIATIPAATALAVGLKVDVDALPPEVIAALQQIN